MIHVEPMTPDEAIQAAEGVTPLVGANAVIMAGPERTAALMLAISDALSSDCPCNCCASFRAIGLGWVDADST